MATGFTAQTAAAQDPAFVQQVRAAVCLAAEQVYSEGSGTAGHAARANLATRILQQPDSYAPMFAAAIAASTANGIDKTATDAAVSTAIAGVYNAIAGA